MINIAQQGKRPRKSVKLSKEEHKALLQFVKAFASIVEAAEIIGIHRNVLDYVMIKGSGSPASISAIRDKVSGLVRD